MMKTTHSLAETGEFLRLALPLMTRYKIPITPANYAVWYAYVAGTHEKLKSKIDGFIKEGTQITQDMTGAIYNEFIDIKHELQQLEICQESFASLHENVTSVLDKACGETSEYGEALHRYQDRMRPDLNLEQVSSLITDLNTATNQMLVNNRHLLKDLNEARQEISDLKKQLRKVKREAKTDALTGLANRKAFIEQIYEMASSGEFGQGRHSLMMLDIDNFKGVNDTFGHLFGDKVIRVVATLLKKNTKGKDLPARFGGEEFIVLLPDTNLEGSRIVAEKFRSTIEKSCIINPNNQQVVSKITISIGLTEFCAEDDIEAVIHRADKALYEAKHKGRNRVAEAVGDYVTGYTPVVTCDMGGLDVPLQ